MFFFILFLLLFLEVARLPAKGDAASISPAKTSASAHASAAAPALVRLEQPREHLVGSSGSRHRGSTQHCVVRGGEAQVPHRERGALKLLLEHACRGAVDGAAQVVRGLEGVLDADEVALVALLIDVWSV